MTHALKGQQIPSVPPQQGNEFVSNVQGELQLMTKPFITL